MIPGITALQAQAMYRIRSTCTEILMLVWLLRTSPQHPLYNLHWTAARTQLFHAPSDLPLRTNSSPPINLQIHTRHELPLITAQIRTQIRHVLGIRQAP